MARFDGKTIIVTGAASGIGRASAIRFADEGGAIALVDRDEKGLIQTASAIKNTGGDHSQHAVDVADNVQVHGCVDAIIETHRKIDTLLNIAGINAVGALESIDEQVWDEAMAVNLKSVYSFCHAVWPYMKTQGASAIVNMSSIMGLVGGSGAPAYCTAKAGVLMLTRCLAKDGAIHGIRVNAVCPGFIDTPILRQGYEGNPDFDAMKKHVIDSQPMGRIGTAEEVAGAIAFLASDDASFISGSSLTIDGALSATQIDG